MTTKHENYELLNLIGYGLAKFDNGFVKYFGFSTKHSFYEHLVSLGIAETTGVVKNRQDMFDPFFENDRSGWWQRGGDYIHRKYHIDSLFGELDGSAYADIVKLHIYSRYYGINEKVQDLGPIVQSRYAAAQNSERQAESFFRSNYQQIAIFEDGKIEDARLYKDGYDFQVEVGGKFFLADIKGMKGHKGSVWISDGEYEKADKYQDEYALIVVSNLSDKPSMQAVFNPLDRLDFFQYAVGMEKSGYHTDVLKWPQ